MIVWMGPKKLRVVAAAIRPTSPASTAAMI